MCPYALLRALHVSIVLKRSAWAPLFVQWVREVGEEDSLIELHHKYGRGVDVAMVDAAENR
jgi:hypothetical protein